MPSLLSRLVPVLLRASGAHRPYASAAAAERYIARRAATPRSYAPGRLPRDVLVSESIHEGWPVYVLTPRSGARRGAVIYVHGGSWVNEILPIHWRLAARIAVHARTTVIVPIYPLAPFGSAREVNAVMVRLIMTAREEHGRVSIVGDSAGGQIALSAALTLRDEQGVTPALTALITPAVDPSMENPDIDLIQDSDPWLTKAGALVFVDTWRGERSPHDHRLNALEADLRGLGPLLIFSGTRDILHPDAKLLARAASAAGVTVDYHEGRGLLHVYPLMPTREGRAARTQLIRRIHEATHAV